MNDKTFLQRAVDLSKISKEPVGCATIIVINNEVVAEEFNSQNVDNIAVHHAELKAVYQANTKLGKRKLEGATAYCSCEPCVMCIAALSYAKVQRIVFDKNYERDVS